MTELDELFRDAVAAAPPSRLTSTGVLDAVDRRSRRRVAVVAGIGLLVGSLVTVAGLNLGSRNPANPPGGASPPGSLVWAGRGDATHLYRLTYTCGVNPRLPLSYTPTATATPDLPPPGPCSKLWASADGGATWTARGSTEAQEILIVGPTTLLRYAGSATTNNPATTSAPPLELSTDAGATWARLAPDGSPIEAIPAGGVMTPYGGLSDHLVFDPAQRNLRPLAHGPELMPEPPVVNGHGPTSTVWVGVADQAGNAAISVSHDGGGSWLTRSLPGLTTTSAGTPYLYGLTSRDGTTAYAFVYDDAAPVHTADPAIPGTDGYGWFRAFRTTDGGASWHDLDAGSAAVAPSYSRVWLTTDGRLVLFLNNRSAIGAASPSEPVAVPPAGAEFVVSDDGHAYRTATPPGLADDLLDVDGSVAYSDHAMYVSDDGWTWREVWHE